MTELEPCSTVADHNKGITKKGLEQIIKTVVNRDWASQEQVDSTIASIDSGGLDGPLHKGLKQQRLLTPEQFDMLDDMTCLGLRIGAYEVERKIGSGAMGDVFLAVDTESKDELTPKVALKVVNQRYADDDSFLRRFSREAEALKGLSHPNVASSIGYGFDNGRHYMAMEFVAGPSLAQLLDEHGPMPEPYVLRMMLQLANGLDYVYHMTRLVHRDLKPENVLTEIPAGESTKNLFSRQDVAKLIDFGLARNFNENDRLTMTGITMGTPHYMSPEQIRGAQDLDCRSDIYGLGATAFHLLTGKTPYQGASPGAVMTAHLTEKVPDPADHVPGMSGRMRSLIMTCMAKEAQDRFLSYQGLTQAIKKALESQSEEEGNAGPRLLRKPLVLPKVRGGKRAEDAEPGEDSGAERGAYGEIQEPGGPAAEEAAAIPAEAPAPVGSYPGEAEGLPPPLEDLPEFNKQAVDPPPQLPSEPTPAGPNDITMAASAPSPQSEAEDQRPGALTPRQPGPSISPGNRTPLQSATLPDRTPAQSRTLPDRTPAAHNPTLPERTPAQNQRLAGEPETEREAALRAEALHTPSIGMVPWLTLGISVAILCTLLALRFIGGAA